MYTENSKYECYLNCAGRCRIREEGQNRLAMRGNTHPQEVCANRCTLFGGHFDLSIVSMRIVQKNATTNISIQQQQTERL